MMLDFYVCCNGHKVYTEFFAPAVKGNLKASVKEFIAVHYDCEIKVVSAIELPTLTESDEWREV